MDKDSNEQEILTLSLAITNTISAIGCIFIILAYVTMKRDLFSIRLVVYMSIADLIHSLCLIISPLSSIWCLVQSILLEFSSASSILWSAIMAFAIFQVVVKNDDYVERNEKLFVIIGYILPLILTCLPLSTNSYGYTQGWCWIKSGNNDFIWRLVCFYMVLFCVIIYNLVVYWIVFKKIRNEIINAIDDEEVQSINKDLLNRLRFYPIILIVCYSAVTIKRVYEFFNPEGGERMLTWVSGLMISLLGLLNSIVYGLSKDVREHLKGMCKRPLGVFKPFASLEGNENINP